MQAVMTEVNVQTLGRTRFFSMSWSMPSAVGKSSALPTASMREVKVLTVGCCAMRRGQETAARWSA